MSDLKNDWVYGDTVMAGDMNDIANAVNSKLDASALDGVAQESSVQAIDTKIGTTTDTGGSATTGTVMGKLNALEDKLLTLNTNDLLYTYGYADCHYGYTGQPHTAISITGAGDIYLFRYNLAAHEYYQNSTYAPHYVARVYIDGEVFIQADLRNTTYNTPSNRNSGFNYLQQYILAREFAAPSLRFWGSSDFWFDNSVTSDGTTYRPSYMDGGREIFSGSQSTSTFREYRYYYWKGTPIHFNSSFVVDLSVENSTTPAWSQNDEGTLTANMYYALA